MKSLYFTAGQFARLHQLNKRTLHYYDDIGLFSPAYKGENGYRYYTYQQSAQLENILAMRQLNMSIEEIAAYLKHPNPQDFLKISQNKIEEIDQQIQQLQVLKQVFEQRQQSLARSEQIHDGQIEVESFAAHHYLLTPMPVEDNPMRNMQQIMQHLQSAWEHSSYKAGCGSYISLEKALQGQFEAAQADAQRLAYFRKSEIDPATYEMFLVGYDMLTPTEREILDALADGSSPREISEQRNCSESTIATHRKNIYRKLGIHKAYQLKICIALLRQEREAQN